MKNKILKSLCLGAAMVCSVSATAQNQTVKGTVVDENGEPVIGASVVIAGKQGQGVITDLDGNYTIQAPKGSKVTISYIGYITQTVVPGGKVKLKEDSQNLEEVVVVGYGVQKKAHLTGAISTVPMDEIQDMSSGDVASSLSGLVNGLNVSSPTIDRPGESSRLSIRDASSIGDVGGTAQEPLYVIDGFIYPNSQKLGNVDGVNPGAQAFNNLDPSTIENITVLKDAAAAVYGARAANGVILVTTKKGKLGAPKISYSGQFGLTDAVSHPKMLSAYNYGRLYNAIAAADPKNTTLNLRTDLFQADEIEAMKSLNYNLLDKYWDTGFTQKHSVNVSGASDKANYYANMGYFKQDGNLGNMEYDRWNYRAGVDLHISKWVKASMQVSGDYGKKNKPNVKVGGTNDQKDYNLLLTRPYYIPEYVNGLPIAAYGPSNSQKNADQNYAYDVLQNSGDYSRNSTNNMTLNAAIDYDFGWFKPLKGLKARFSYAKSINNDKTNQYGSSYEIYRMVERAGSGSHLYTPTGNEDWDVLMSDANFVLGNGGSVVLNGGSGSGYLSRNMLRSDNYQMNFTLTYGRDFGAHHVSALFSIEKGESESEYLYGYVTNPYSFSTGQSNSVGTGSEMSTTFTRSEAGTLSYIGRVNYAYANKYLLEFLFRSDASTKFAPENYWGYFPSISAGWVVSEEEWFKRALPKVDFFKIRGSFGLTGRDNTTAWMWTQTYATDKDKGAPFGTGTSNNAGSHITLNKNNSAVNYDAHWDKTYKSNLGFDINLLKNRLSINIDGYYEWNREMLLPYSASIPGIIGTMSAPINYGEMDSYGVELSVTWRDKIGKDFKYKVGINTGYNDNKVLVMDWEKDEAYRQIRKGNRTDMGEWGMECIGMFRSFQEIYEYFDKYNITSYMNLSRDEVRPGMLIYKDVRGAYDEATDSYAGPNGIVKEDEDKVCLSNRNNPYGFTANLSAEWKGISLTAQISANWGGYSFVDAAALKPGSSIEYTNMPSFWNPDDMFVYSDIYDASGNLLMKANHNASLPNLAYSDINSVQSSFWRISGTRVRLSRLTLAYSLPKNWLKPIGLESVRFNVTGQNLLSFYNPYPDNYIDPMCKYGYYPALRKWTIGVNVSF
ncbi:MAG: TonB-dependent receptor [Prevotella sp.]|nr:TonB-dependent receptor [Bacteroidales bacterium]MDY2693107.1 TonB-dependent receptor [Prevotella sp.]MDY4732575.1 TonB-dependent receptor [Prevotella sp.]MDY6027778.1 TonB-dependent receptor [Prevotella sp.]